MKRNETEEIMDAGIEPAQGSPGSAIDWRRKLTSRKLWMAAAAFVSGLILAFGGRATTAETVSGCILQGAAVLGYVFAEGLTDSNSAAALGEERQKLLAEAEFRIMMLREKLEAAEKAAAAAEAHEDAPEGEAGEADDEEQKDGAT